MATYEFTSPDGKVYEITGPEGATQAQAFEMLQTQIVAGSTPPTQEPSLPVQAGRALNGIPRQLGLTARYALEGAPQVAQIVTEPIRQMITDPLLRAFGGKGGRPLTDEASSLADRFGLPKPETPAERVVGDAARMMAGAGGAAGAAGAGARAISGPATEMLAGQAPAALTGGQNLLRGLASQPAQQLASAGGAGLAGGASREAGGDPLRQAGAALLGGVAGGFAPGLGSSLAGMARSRLTRELTPQQIDVQLSALLQQNGTDYSRLAPQVRAGLRKELESALRVGKDLDPAAVERLAAFKAIPGATPTRGMLSQNPVDITREMNLAKTAANSSDGQLHGLPMLQHRNNTALIGRLNDAGAARGDAFDAGSKATGAIIARDAAEAARVTGLYNTARGMPGGAAPLERTAVVNGIYDALARENKMAFLPENVSSMLNTISKGQINVGGQVHQVPFDANALDNLMTTIATAQRGTQDGNVKAALAIARKAIDAAPVNPLGGGAEAPAFMEALNQARAGARSRFQWQESSKPVEAALKGAEPDKFVQKFVLGGSLSDAQALAREAPVAPIKDAIVAHLKEKALSNASDEVGKFSQSAYNKALAAIGDRKLGVFFDADELAQLKGVGRVASLMQTQPVGSAVNNSNSGALLLGRGVDLLGKVPVLGPMTGPALNNINVSVQQRAAQNYAPSLLRTEPGFDRRVPLLLPAAAMGGGLLSIP